MKNKEFWKGAVAGALVVTCIGTGVFAGTGLAAKGTALGDRKCTSKLAYLEELIDRYYLGDKDEEKLQEGLYAGLLYGLDDPYSRYYTAEEYDSENSSNEGSYVGIGILMEDDVSHHQLPQASHHINLSVPPSFSLKALHIYLFLPHIQLQ